MKLERWGWYSVLVNVLLACLHGLIPSFREADEVNGQAANLSE